MHQTTTLNKNPRHQAKMRLTLPPKPPGPSVTCSLSRSSTNSALTSSQLTFDFYPAQSQAPSWRVLGPSQASSAWALLPHQPTQSWAPCYTSQVLHVQTRITISQFTSASVHLQGRNPRKPSFCSLSSFSKEYSPFLSRSPSLLL